MMTPKKAISTYLVLQAVCCSIWWICLTAKSISAEWFFPSNSADQLIASFSIPDIFLIVFGSLFCSYGVYNEKKWAGVAIWSLSAACWYPALFCLGQSLFLDTAWVGTSMMFCMSGMTLSMATVYGFGNQESAYFREFSASPAESLFWTGSQIFIFWITFLFVLPKGLVELSTSFGLVFMEFSNLTIPGIVLFVGMGSLGLFSGWQFAVIGKATPLPPATPPVFVKSGPYRWVRNPMAIAGIGQAIAVGLMLGNAAVIAYSIIGAIVWHVFVRPVEELDLENRFGEEFREYRSNTGLWVPRLWSIHLETKRESLIDFQAQSNRT